MVKGSENKVEVKFTGNSDDLIKSMAAVSKGFGKLNVQAKSVDNVFEAIKKNLPKKLGDFAKKYGKQLEETLDKTLELDFLRAPVANSLKGLEKDSKDAFAVLFEGLGKGNLKKFGDNFDAFTQNMGRSFKTSLKGMAAGFTADAVLAPFKGVGRAATKELGGIVTSAVFDPLKAQGKELFGGLLNSFKGFGKEIAGSLGGLIGLAEGGLVKKPTLAMVGEAGPEAHRPRPERITPTSVSHFPRINLWTKANKCHKLIFVW